MQSTFDKRDAFSGGKPIREFFVRSDSFHRQNVQCLAALIL
jgi:hypothetical protein